jgi:hypothetical protein
MEMKIWEFLAFTGMGPPAPRGWTTFSCGPIAWHPSMFPLSGRVVTILMMSIFGASRIE